MAVDKRPIDHLTSTCERKSHCATAAAHATDKAKDREDDGHRGSLEVKGLEVGQAIPTNQLTARASLPTKKPPPGDGAKEWFVSQIWRPR